MMRVLRRIGRTAAGLASWITSARPAAYNPTDAIEYWRMVPTASYKIDSRALVTQPPECVVAAWEAGLEDYLRGWDQRGFLPLIRRYQAMFEDKTVLEVGCGLGFEHLHFYAPTTRRSILGDIVPTNVDVVRTVIGAKDL